MRYVSGEGIDQMRAWMTAVAVVVLGCGGAASTTIDGQPGPAPTATAPSAVSADPKPAPDAGLPPACSPITCAQVGPSCATWNDECGGTITCHTCGEDAGAPVDPATDASPSDPPAEAEATDAVTTLVESGPPPECLTGATKCADDFRFYQCDGSQQWQWMQGSAAASCCHNLPRYTKSTETSYGCVQTASGCDTTLLPDGTITGSITASGTAATVTDSTTGLVWGPADCPVDNVNPAAQCACSRLGGHAWRPPTTSEAQTLLIGPPVVVGGRTVSVCEPEIDTSSFSFSPVAIYTSDGTGAFSYAPGQLGDFPLCVQTN